MRINGNLLLIVLMGGIRWASAREEITVTTAEAAPSEPTLPVASGPAPGTEPSRARVRCEHSKLNTQDADPLGAGAWQLQFNGGYNDATRQWDPSWKEKGRHRAYERSNQEALTYGVSDALDLGVGLGYAWLADDDTGLQSGHGLSDLVASAKWRFFEKEEDGIAVAYLPTLTVPTGKKSSDDRLGPSQEFWSLDTRFAVVKDGANRWSANADIGCTTALGDGGFSWGSLSANGAVGYYLFPRLQPDVELNYSHDFVPHDRDADLLAVTVGAGLPLSDRWCVRTGAQRGIAGRNADQFTVLLLSADLNF